MIVSAIVTVVIGKIPTEKVAENESKYNTLLLLAGIGSLGGFVMMMYEIFSTQ